MTTGIKAPTSTTGSLQINGVDAVTFDSTGILTGVNKAAVSQMPTLGTAQNTTSGTSIDFTGIPSWVKRIMVMLNGVSTNGTSNEILQIGSTSVQVSGYLGSAATNTTYGAFTTGFGLGATITSASILHGVATLVSLGSNVWAFSFNGTYSNAPATAQASGSVTLSGALDRIRLTTVNGTDTFDAGSINIFYE